jgi:hypothetical protein
VGIPAVTGPSREATWWESRLCIDSLQRVKKNEKNQKGKTGNEISSFFPSSFVRQRSSTLLQCHNLMVHRPRAYCDSAAEFPEIIDDRIQTLLILMKMRNVSSAAGKSRTLLDIDIDEASNSSLALDPWSLSRQFMYLSKWLRGFSSCFCRQ